MSGKCRFLTNHSLVLLVIKEKPQFTAPEIAHKIGISKRTTRTIISALEGEKYIIKVKIGRKVNYTINPSLPLRQKNILAIEVGKLLGIAKILGC